MSEVKKEDVIVKTRIKPDICPLCKKPTELIGIGIYECNGCKNRWFEDGIILEERHIEEYHKSEALLTKLYIEEHHKDEIFQEKSKETEKKEVKKDEAKKEEVKKEEKKDDKDDKKEEVKKKFDRPHRLPGSTIEIETGCGNLLLTLNHTEDKKIVEVLLVSNPAGGCGSAFLNMAGITLSFYLQEWGDIRRYIRKMMGTKCPRSRPSAKSCPEAIVQALKEEIAFLKGGVKEEAKVKGELGEKAKEEPKEKEVTLVRGETCPECNSLLVMQEGCKLCRSCGWSECT